MARKSGSDGVETAREIRKQALRLFTQKGYAAVSMRAIAQEVGVRVGALYLYTPDKQSLLVDLLSEHMETLLEGWAAADPVQKDAPERLDAFVSYLIRYNIERSEELFIAHMELRSLSPENFTKIEAMRRQYEDGLEQILAAGVAEGVFRAVDTRIATLAILAMLNGVNAWYREGGRLSTSRIEVMYWKMARGLVGHAS